MNKRIIGQVFTAFVLLAAMQAASAQENIKIGVVNLDRIARESNAAKAGNAKIEAEFSKRSKDLQDAAARLKAAADKFDKDAPVLSDTDRQRRQRELADMDKDLQRRQREANEDFNQRRKEENDAITDRANKALRQLADQEKYDLVLTDAVIVSPRMDITDKLLKVMNAAPSPAASK
jgi:outer membrane protein